MLVKYLKAKDGVQVRYLTRTNVEIYLFLPRRLLTLVLSFRATSNEKARFGAFVSFVIKKNVTLYKTNRQPYNDMRWLAVYAIEVIELISHY